MKDKDCTRCGRCCIVCTEIQLTREEVREELYPKQRMGKIKDNVEGWSKWKIRRGKTYEPQLRREIFACVFWDPLTRECLIYEDRPVVCRIFKCTKKGSPRIHRTWLKIKKRRLEALCLEA